MCISLVLLKLCDWFYPFASLTKHSALHIKIVRTNKMEGFDYPPLTKR